MPRIKLKPLENYPFFIQITVRTTDLNYGGHLGNDRLLALVHEARIAFLAQFGFSELDCGGISLIMGDAAIVFQGEAFAGDVLKVEVAAGEPTRSGIPPVLPDHRRPGQTGCCLGRDRYDLL